MKFYELGFIIYIIVFICAGCAIAAGNYMYDEYWPDDNPVEEYIENEIEKNTGINIDLTPASPDK